MTSPEHNRTLHKRCPGFLPDRLISINRKTYLITYPQCIDLMPRVRTMKIDFPVLPVIKIIERDRIRYPSPHSPQDTSPAVLQKFLRRAILDLISLFSNLSKHNSTLLIHNIIQPSSFPAPNTWQILPDPLYLTRLDSSSSSFSNAFSSPGYTPYFIKLCFSLCRIQALTLLTL